VDRIRILSVLVTVAGVILVGRYLQKAVFEHGTYRALANKQYLEERDIPARRGTIYATDKEGDSFADKTLAYYPLALDTLKYSVWVVPKNIENPDEAAKKMKEIFPELDEAALAGDFKTGKLYLPPIVRRVDKTVAGRVTELNLRGVLVVPEHVRLYPEGALASQMLGFVDREGAGQYGLEAQYQNLLVGQAGKITGEKDTRGRFIATLSSEDSRDGASVVLSIDHAVQFMVEQKLKEAVEEKFKAKGGSVVVLNPKTGGILAMASIPTFDPNKYNEVPTEGQKVFLNPAISSIYEPGSVMKAVVMAGALSEGKVTPETEGTFSNMTVVDGYEIHTAEDKAFGKENMTQVLENSDNVAMVWVADQLGNDLMYKNFSQFGFGEKTGIDLRSEISGTLPALKNWRPIHRATTAFGQGIAVTPLQMVSAIGALGNKGKLMQPHLVEKIIYPDGQEETIAPKEVRAAVSEQAAADVTKMLISVVDNGHGKRAGVPGFYVAGKTGTAQIPNPSGGYYEDRHIGGFAGYFPANDPQFAMVVKLDEPQGVKFAESSAAPLFGEIAAWLVNYAGLKPER